MKYPENIVTLRQKIAHVIYWHMFVFEKGKGEVVGRFFSTYTEIGITLLLLDKFHVQYTWITAIIFIAVAVLVLYLLGWGYLRYGFDKINTQISQARNPHLMEIHQRLVRKRSKI